MGYTATGSFEFDQSETLLSKKFHDQCDITPKAKAKDIFDTDFFTNSKKQSQDMDSFDINNSKLNKLFIKIKNKNSESPETFDKLSSPLIKPALGGNVPLAVLRRNSKKSSEQIRGDDEKLINKSQK